MVATVRTRGVLKASQNRVRTSVALQGNAMWENVIGITEQAGTNTGVEALIHAPTHGGGRKAKDARRAAAHEAILASGGFDTDITSYQSLLSLAKSQGATGANASRGACKVCGQLGHLTKQCRNQFSAFFDAGGGAGGEAGAPGDAPGGGAVMRGVEDGEGELSSDISSSSSDSDSSADERRRRKEKKRRHKEKKARKEKKAKKSKKHKKEKSSKEKSSKHSKKRSRRSDSGSDSD